MSVVEAIQPVAFVLVASAVVCIAGAKDTGLNES
jgi:hypothetical protein